MILLIIVDKNRLYFDFVIPLTQSL